MPDVQHYHTGRFGGFLADFGGSSHARRPIQLRAQKNPVPEIFCDSFSAITQGIGRNCSSATHAIKPQAQCIEQLKLLPLSQEERTPSVRHVNLISPRSVSIQCIERCRKTGIAIDHRFFCSRNISANVTGIASKLSCRARFSKSTKTDLAGAGVHVPRTWPRSVTRRGRFLTVRNSFVKRRVEICMVAMSDIG
jgi:hypothetical protein